MSKSETAEFTPTPDVNWQILDNVKLLIVWQNIDTRSTERLIYARLLTVYERWK